MGVEFEHGEKIDWRAYHEKLRTTIEMERLLPLLGVVIPECLGSSGYKVLCPAHADRTPSMHVYSAQNRAWCYSCSRGFDTIGLTAAVRNVEYTEAADWLGEQFGICPNDCTSGVPLPVSPSRIVRPRLSLVQKPPQPMDAGLARLYHRQLGPDEYEWYEKERLLPPWVVDSLLLGHTLPGEFPPAFTIPVWGRRVGEDLVTVRYRLDDREPGVAPSEDLQHLAVRKYWGRRGRNSVYPFGMFSLACQSDWVVICESELDQLALFAWGIPAFTLTAGAIAQAKHLIAWERHISDFPRWVIAVDDDDAGREATSIITARWQTRAVPFSWPEHAWNGEHDGKRKAGDVTDFLHCFGYGEFLDGVERAISENRSVSIFGGGKLLWRGWGQQQVQWVG